jgi:hypothetical protein
MVDDLEAGRLKLAREDSLRDSHSHSVADALAQRSGSRLHSGRVAALGVTGGSRTPLPKVPQLVEREVVTCKMENRVLQHGRVTARQHKPVAVGPGRVVGVVLEEAGPERKRGGGQGHRGTGMTRLGSLDGIHRERAHGVDGNPGGGWLGHGRVRAHRTGARSLDGQGGAPLGLASGKRKDRRRRC